MMLDPPAPMRVVVDVASPGFPRLLSELEHDATKKAIAAQYPKCRMPNLHASIRNHATASTWRSSNAGAQNVLDYLPSLYLRRTDRHKEKRSQTSMLTAHFRMPTVNFGF